MDSSGNPLSPNEHAISTLRLLDQAPLVEEHSGGELELGEDSQPSAIRNSSIQSDLPQLAWGIDILRTLLVALISTLWIRLAGNFLSGTEPTPADPLFNQLQVGDGGAEHVEQEVLAPPPETHGPHETHPPRDTNHGNMIHVHSENLLPTPREVISDIVITRIQAVGVTAGLRRTPVGFYIAIRSEGQEWRTSNKPVLVENDTLVWDEAIVLPSEPSASVRLEIRASYEFAPMLGRGEELSATNVTVGQLIIHSTRGLPMKFFPRDEEPLSHSSLLVTVERRASEPTEVASTLLYCPPNSERLRRLEEATDIGHSALSRYQKHRRKQDLEQALGQYQRALNICPPEHPSRAAPLSNLAMVKLINYRVNGSCFDLEDSISMYRDALDLRPSGHPDRPSTLRWLATALLVQSQNQHSETHVVQGGELLRQVLELSDAESYEHRMASLMLETQHVWNAVRTQVVDEPLVWPWVDFIEGFTDDEPADLGAQLLHRFHRHGNLENLELGIFLLDAHRRAVSCRDPKYPWIMCNLGAALVHQFKRHGELAYIDQAIAKFEVALQFAPYGHPGRVTCLSNLSICFRTRFDRLGYLVDLHQAIANQQKIAQDTPDDHPDYAGRLNGLAVSFSIRFDRLGSLPDLNHAIATFEESLRLTPEDHSDRASRLNNLGVLYNTRFRRLGDIGDIGHAIDMQRIAVQLTPDTHPDYARRLNNLGNSFNTRFQRHGELADLNLAIEVQECALRLTPGDHPERAGRLNNLGVSLKARFDRLGDIRDLDQAISTQQEAVRLTPGDHHNRAGHLNNLGVSLSTRFNRLGDISDLEQAIASQEEAVRLTPSDHPDLPGRSSNLGISHRSLFRQLGNLGSLNQAILGQEEAVELSPDDHPDRAGHLNNLGVSLNTRFHHTHDLQDINRAIQWQEEAVRLTPIDHSDRGGRLSNLGISFRTRFDHGGDRVDVEQAIAVQEEAIQLTPFDHPSRVPYLYNLGLSHLASFNHLNDRFVLQKAISCFSGAAESATGPTSVRFSASRKWISCARLFGNSSVLDAYSVAVQLIPQLAWIGLPLHSRYQELLRAADVTREAASAALEYGQAETAVEWLEQGRSVVWAELLQLRAPLDELRALHPALAARLLDLSSALEHTRSRDQPTPLAISLEEQAQRHRALALERENLLREIRSLPGFEGFLLGKKFDQLRPSAHSGPVVNLNASERGCDALIVLAHVDHVLHVPLPNITITEAKSMVNILDQLVPGGRGPPRLPDDLEARGGRPPNEVRANVDAYFCEILGTLWTNVVRPVLSALRLSTPGELSRIFWCPAGPFSFLPIHAAGLYDTKKPGSTLSDYVISSYTPTLSALILTAQPNTAKNIRLLAVSQPSSDGQVHLPGARKETELVKARSRPSPYITLVETKANVEDVLENMKDSDWVHFACHGVQDPASPLDSGLILADQRRLKLSDIVQLSRPRGGLAFLSACQTATGDGRLSEEALHLAAGMLFAGYSSIIATMWSILDHEGPEIAADVYGQLFKDDEAPDSAQAARALHFAVQRFRQRGAPFTSWAAIIHMGL